jgi:hypothetical protein
MVGVELASTRLRETSTSSKFLTGTALDKMYNQGNCPLADYTL